MFLFRFKQVLIINSTLTKDIVSVIKLSLCSVLYFCHFYYVLVMFKPHVHFFIGRLCRILNRMHHTYCMPANEFFHLLIETVYCFAQKC